MAVLKKKPAVFFGLALIIAVAGVGVELVFTPDYTDVNLYEHAYESNAALWGKVLIGLATMILGLAIQGAFAYAVFRVMRDEDAGVGDSITRGMARVVPLALVAILTGILTSIGLALLVIPGLILICMWAVAVPACVVEKLGPLESLSRSANLTKGYRMPIFGLFFLTYLAIYALNYFMASIVAAATGSYVTAIVISAVIGVIPETFLYVLTATVYYDLRSAKEGISLDSLVNVFD